MHITDFTECAHDVETLMHREAASSKSRKTSDRTRVNIKKALSPHFASTLTSVKFSTLFVQASFAMFSLKTLLVSAALAVSAAAAPASLSMRAGGYPIVPGDNGSCVQYLKLCGAQLGSSATAVGVEGGEFNVSRECAVSATCHTMFYNGTVDDWIETMFGPDAVKSAEAKRLPEGVSRYLSGDDCVKLMSAWS